MSDAGDESPADDSTADEPIADEPTEADPTSDEPDAPDEPPADEPDDAPAHTDRQPTMPVKRAPDGNSIVRGISPERWETVGRRAICDVLRQHRVEMNHEIDEVIATIEYGTPLDPSNLMRLRDAIEELEVFVEADLAYLVPDADPWKRTVGRLPDGAMRDALGISRDELTQFYDLKYGSDSD